MAKMPLLLGATLLMTALSGCADSGDEPKGPQCDLEANYLDADGACTPHTEPFLWAELPESATQFTSVDIPWGLNNGTRGTNESAVHSMDNRLVAQTNGTAPTNMTDPRSVTWGVEIDRREHQDLPQEFTATFRWDNAQTLQMWGYMRIDGQHIWQDLGQLIVLAPKPSGQAVTFTVSGTPPDLDSDSQNGKVGDMVTFDNQNSIYGYDITFSGNNCPELPAISVSAGGTASTNPILVLGSCDFTMATDASPTVNLGDLTGRFSISAP